MWLKFKKVSKFSTFFLVLFLLASSIWAVEQTGTLSGVVKDEKGLPLPGATVSIKSPNLMGGEKAAITDTKGVFNFYNLPPGDYEVKISMPGYVTYVVSDQRVSIGQTRFLSVPMRAGEIKEEVTVTAEAPMIDPKSNTTSDNFSNIVIQNIQIGAGQRSYQNVFQQSPGVAGGANPSIRGGTLGENVYLVDGVDTTDPVTSTFGLNFNFDAIEEVQLQTGGFTAEYGRATGGIGNIITKSGGNEFEGTFDIRYRNESLAQKGKHFDPDKSPTSFFNPAFTFGGPFVKDKLWFFFSYQYVDSKQTPFEAPASFNYKGSNYIAKLTWMVNSNNKLVFQVQGDPAEIANDNVGISPLVTVDSTSFQKQGANFFTLKWYSALSANLWLEAQAGYYKSVLDSYPQSRNFTTQANYISNLDLLTLNYWDAQYSDRFRNQANAILTYFKRGWVGSHQFKFGVDLQDVKQTYDQFTPGGGYYSSATFDDTNYRYYHWVDVPAGPLDNAGKLLAGFIQDEWIMHPKFTANIGVRFDSAKYKNDISKEVFDFSLTQPRIGFAFDAKADGSRVFKWSYGIYMHPSLLALPRFLNSRANATELYFVEEYWGDLNEDGDTDDELYYTTFGGPGGTVVDPKGLDPTYVKEYQIGYEHKLTPRQGLKLTWVYRKTDDLIEDVYGGMDGRDNNLDGTIDDSGEEVYYIVNLKNGRRRYYGAELRYDVRIPRGEIIASYSYGVAKGNIEYNQSAGTDFDYPDLSDHRYGYLSYDRRHAVKVNGYIQLPVGFQVGWDAIYYTGEPYNVLEPAAFYGDHFVEPRGSRRLPNFYQLNLEGKKNFKIGKTNAQIILAILNVLDDEAVLSVDEYITSPGFTQPLTYQQPRYYEIGLRYQF